jgi:hypothetical protein
MGENIMSPNNGTETPNLSANNSTNPNGNQPQQNNNPSSPSAPVTNQTNNNDALMNALKQKLDDEELKQLMLLLNPQQNAGQPNRI